MCTHCALRHNFLDAYPTPRPAGNSEASAGNSEESASNSEASAGNTEGSMASITSDNKKRVGRNRLHPLFACLTRVATA